MLAHKESNGIPNLDIDSAHKEGSNIEKCPTTKEYGLLSWTVSFQKKTISQTYYLKIKERGEGELGGECLLDLPVCGFLEFHRTLQNPASSFTVTMICNNKFREVGGDS